MKKEDNMKKLSVILLLILLLTTACSENTFEDYQTALAKTETIKRGKLNTNMDLNLTFNTEDLSSEDIKRVKNFEKVAYEGTMSFDYTQDEKMVSSLNLLSLGGLGMNFDFYMQGDQMALYIPMLGKFLDLDSKSISQMSEENNDLAAFSNLSLTDESISALEQIWSQTFEADEVVKGEKSTMETPEGDVRVVKFTVTPEKEKLKEFVNKASRIVIEDSNIKEALESQMAKSNNQDFSWEETLTEIMQDFEESMQYWEVKQFEVVDFIDVDGYIVESNVSVTIGFTASKPGSLTDFQMDFVTSYYEIEKKQNIEFPELTEENSVTIESLQQGLPSTYENLLN